MPLRKDDFGCRATGEADEGGRGAARGAHTTPSAVQCEGFGRRSPRAGRRDQATWRSRKGFVEAVSIGSRECSCSAGAGVSPLMETMVHNVETFHQPPNLLLKA